ncbi:uncharacterized protein LOC6539848 isoform X2 [Drosophila yakuba]|uniref:Uncharacterized protein, isoform B n=1 Tax=Drosophila yakuba TaxID=7245 RepID=A0A0R1E8M9_DROYA|nr:uncharacterized protein LOC6539848 isoform X2 [Drosophila yakuba]KRK03062.1 uncharacterized protein Dyak_GE24958, isoform B [Drosophila yakuba]KRK05429.1 uncharacterized protein Dyak_GE11165, isoform B [Drosophila yakuba]
MEPKVTIHRYYSRKAKYEGSVEADLELCIKHCGGDVLDVKYILILRTKGSQFMKRPIIPLFNSQSPPFECMLHACGVLHRYWLNSTKDRSEQSYIKDKQSLVNS